MRDHARVQFSTASTDDEERFLRGYVADAVERLPDRDDCDMFVYIRAGHDETVDGGLVIVDVYGEAEAVVDRERGTWDDLVADGPLEAWERDDTDVVGLLAREFADVERHERMRYLASRMSAAAFDELDEAPPPVGSTDDETWPAGWYRVPHILANHQGYPLEDELDAHVQNVRMLLGAIARMTDADTAHDRLDDVFADLEATRDRIDELAAAPDDLEDDQG